ncbi:hypothetical protein [Ramlibacter sp. AN1133]|uniref:hypothetical protein n=1 Tax=Ramlibacter sp. AN1133 TaxID=3133429 RepID=UPI0030BE4D46
MRRSTPWHLLLSCAVAAVLCVLQGAALAQSAVRLYGREAIPFEDDGRFQEAGAVFTSWSLFLPCNPLWLGAERTQDLARLQSAYRNFATVSGVRHAAVWFTRPASEELDVERAARYCEKFGLLPSGGPYVVVTTVHPDRWQKAGAEGQADDPLLVLSFAGVRAADSALLLTQLNDQLQLKQLSAQALNHRRFYLAWLNALGGVCSYLRDLKVSVSIKVVSLEKASVCPG